MKIGIVGIGGKTGTMFARELKDSGEIFGIGKKEAIEEIKKGKVFVERNGKREKLKCNLIKVEEFPKDFQFDFLFFCIKNPVFDAVKFYYQKIKEKNFSPPALFLPQNGISAGEDAILALREVFGENSKEIPIFRISLFNAVEKKLEGENVIFSYSLPVRLAISQVSGKKLEIKKFFEKTKFEVFFVPTKDSKNMEYSKLFLNLIGMVCATENLSIAEGFKKKEVFKKEVLALREYIRAVKLAGGKFLNFPHYPVKFLSFLFKIPIPVLFLISSFLGNLIEKERKGKKKELEEIDYYNGAVVKLAKKVGFEAKVNQEILEKAKCILKELE
jgi:ketopantoate reductase